MLFAFKEALSVIKATRITMSGPIVFVKNLCLSASLCGQEVQGNVLQTWTISSLHWYLYRNEEISRCWLGACLRCSFTSSKQLNLRLYKRLREAYSKAQFVRPIDSAVTLFFLNAIRQGFFAFYIRLASPGLALLWKTFTSTNVVQNPSKKKNTFSVWAKTTFHLVSTLFLAL